MYPLKFKPIFQKRIWGGTRLHSLLAKNPPKELAPVGESWELADLPPGAVQPDSTGASPDGSLSSTITNGPHAGKTLHQFISEFRIQNSEFKSYFPLLIKFLDAHQDLSLQVHPDQIYIKKHPEAHLKSEAWYIIHADPGAKIYKGLKPGVTRDQFRAALDTREVAPLLNAIPVRPGDCHYLQSGTLHALGAGILAAEVQTPSDTTFRVFDWNRLGPDGKPRKLHIEQAMECINFDPPASPTPQPGSGTPLATRLAACPYFILDRFHVPQSETQIIAPELAVWIILEGQGVINLDAHPPTAPTTLVRGDTLLLPPTMKNPRLQTITNVTFLQASLPETQ